MSFINLLRQIARVVVVTEPAGSRIETLGFRLATEGTLGFSDTVRNLYLLTKCFTIALHAVSHLRHSSAHAFICLSSGNFSHAFAHCSHDFAQHSHIRTECGPLEC
jgi:hypothetical protein